MERYFQKLTGPKFVLLIVLWLFVTNIFSVFALFISPTYALPLASVLGYFIMVYIFKIFGLNDNDITDIRQEPKEKVKKKFILSILPFLVGGMTSILYVLFLQTFLPSLYESYMEQNQLLEGMNFSDFPIQVILLFIAVVILAPIVEEFIFRGVFFNLLSKRLSTVFALVVSSLFFGLLHLQTMVPTAIIGFVLAFIYHKTGSLKIVIAGHMVNNFIAFALSLTPLAQTEELESQALFGGVLAILYIIGTIYFIRYMIINKSFFKEDTPLYRRIDPSERLKENSPRIIDISFNIETGMNVYENDPEVFITEVANVEEHGYSVRKIEMNTHAGTHIDFPSHFYSESSGEPKDLSVFYGQVQVILDFSYHLAPRVVRVIAKNGKLTLERAKELAQTGVRLVGVSGNSIEEEGQDEVHKFLLSQGILIIENLDLYQLGTGMYKLCAFPLKVSGAEAAPARVVLIDDVYRS